MALQWLSKWDSRVKDEIASKRFQDWYVACWTGTGKHGKVGTVVVAKDPIETNPLVAVLEIRVKNAMMETSNQGRGAILRYPVVSGNDLDWIAISHFRSCCRRSEEPPHRDVRRRLKADMHRIGDCGCDSNA